MSRLSNQSVMNCVATQMFLQLGNYWVLSEATRILEMMRARKTENFLYTDYRLLIVLGCSVFVFETSSNYHFLLYYMSIYLEHGVLYSRREATLLRGIRLFYILIQKSVILTDIVALFLCKTSAIGSKLAKLLATLAVLILPDLAVV